MILLGMRNRERILRAGALRVMDQMALTLKDFFIQTAPLGEVEGLQTVIASASFGNLSPEPEIPFICRPDQAS